MSTLELKVPDIGDFKDVEVIEVLVERGDTVEAEQSLITIESDKASMEIPASAGGTIVELKVKLGDKVNEGTTLAVVEAAAGAAKPAPKGAVPPVEGSPSPAPTCPGLGAPGRGAGCCSTAATWPSTRRPPAWASRWKAR